MFIGFYILCLVVGLLLGIAIRKNMQPKCNHKWKLIESGNIFNKDRYGEKIIKGFVKVYECEHCKQMRKEQVTLD